MKLKKWNIIGMMLALPASFLLWTNWNALQIEVAGTLGSVKKLENCAHVRAKLSELNIGGKLVDCGERLDGRGRTAQLLLPGPHGALPIKVYLPANMGASPGILLNITGGPNSQILNASPKNPTELWIWRTALRCNLVAVSPAYLGSFNRSLYPQSSIDPAVDEIAYVVRAIKHWNFKRQVVSPSSLGAYLYSASPDKLARADHLLMVPMINSPEEFLQYIEILSENDDPTLPFSYTSVGYVFENGEKKKKYIKQIDMMNSFFASKGRFKKSFFDNWRDIENYKVSMVFSSNDKRAINRKYANIIAKSNIVYFDTKYHDHAMTTSEMKNAEEFLDNGIEGHCGD